MALPTVVLVHPFPLDSEAFADDAAALAGAMRLVTPNVRGFGGAAPFDAATPPSIAAMADDVARHLDALGIGASADDRVIVGGLSMGGYVALAFARRHRARLRGLILADTRAEPDSPEGRAQRDEAIARIRGGDAEGFVDGMLEKLLAPKSHTARPEVVARVRAIARKASPEALVAALEALRDRPDARPGLADIDVPTLVVVGSDDAVTPPSAAEVIRDGVRGAELAVIPEAGHLTNLESPSAFRDALASFVARSFGEAR